MLQVTYSDYQYTFYVSLLENRNNSKTNQVLSPYLTDSSYGYLWKFTNDMSGEEQWSYGVKGVMNDRYVSYNFFNDSTKNVYTGKLQLIPKGYYKYEIFEVVDNNGCSASGCDTFSSTLGSCPDPTLTSGCKWELKQSSTVVETGTGDLSNKEFSGLAANTYTAYVYQNDSVSSPTNIVTENIVIASKTCSSDPDRYLLITKVDQQKEYMGVTISSIAPADYYVVFTSADSTTYIKHTITSNPETFTINLPAYTTYQEATGANFTAGYGTYNVYLYNASNVLVDTYNQITAMSSDMPSPANVFVLAKNNAYTTTACSQGVATGSIFVASTSADSSGDAASYSYGSRALSKIHEGKLYVNASAGNAQVEYKQHEEPAGTNYIYYGQ